LSNKIAYKGI